MLQEPRRLARMLNATSTTKLLNTRARRPRSFGGCRWTSHELRAKALAFIDPSAQFFVGLSRSPRAVIAHVRPGVAYLPAFSPWHLCCLRRRTKKVMNAATLHLDYQGTSRPAQFSAPTQLRCPHCESIIYSRRSKRCGVCDCQLPEELLFSPEETQRIERLMQSERERHRRWMTKGTITQSCTR
jgi:hypothetical protein